MLEVITGFTHLQELREEWSALWSEDPRATPFQSPEWLIPWTKHLFGGGQLCVLANREAGRLVSLLPLFRYGDNLQNLAFLGSGVTDYLDVIGAPVSDLPGDWEAANLEEVREGSPCLQMGRAEECSICPVIELPATYSDLLAAIDPKLRIDIHRSTNRLFKSGQVTIERTTDLEDLFRLHHARWVARNEEGVLAEGRLQNFHREVADGFEQLGILRLYRLSLDAQVIAVIYAFTHGDACYAYLSGFDPRLSKVSPGTVLLARVIEDAIAEGVTRFDFLRDPDTYKYRWGAKDHRNFQVKITRSPRQSFPD